MRRVSVVRPTTFAGMLVLAALTIACSKLGINSGPEAVTVKLLKAEVVPEKGFSGMVIDESLHITFDFHNNTTKDIAAVKGTVTIYDVFDKKISAFAISDDDDIKAGMSTPWTGTRSIKYALGNNDDRRLAGLPPNKYKVVWEPQVVLFADGSKVEKSVANDGWPETSSSWRWTSRGQIWIMAGAALLVVAFAAVRYSSQLHRILIDVPASGLSAGLQSVRRLGIVGATLLLVGGFAPIISIPIVGSVSIFSTINATAIALLLLAVFSFVFAFRRPKLQIATGTLAASLLLFHLLRIEWGLTTAANAISEGMKDNPFGGLAQLAMGTIQLQWGWLLLFGGAALTIAAGIRSRTTPSEVHNEPAREPTPPTPANEGYAIRQHGPPHHDRAVFSQQFMRLAKLRQQGQLSEQEFAEMKAELIAKAKRRQ